MNLSIDQKEFLTTLDIILTKVEELDVLISIHARNRTARDIMSHKLNGICRTAENALIDIEKDLNDNEDN